MADEKPAAEAGKTAEGAVKPPEQASKVAQYIAERGYTEDQALAAIHQVEALQTREGLAKHVDFIEKEFGNDIAMRVLAANPDDVLKGLDARGRRTIRRAVARRDNPDAELEDDGSGTDSPNPAAEARTMAEEATKMAQQAQAQAFATARAVELAPQLVSLMASSEVASKNPREWTNAIQQRLASNNQRYSGANGIVNAHNDTLAEWKRYGEMAGLAEKAPPVPRGSTGPSVPKDEDVDALISSARKSGDMSKLHALIAQLSD